MLLSWLLVAVLVLLGLLEFAAWFGATDTRDGYNSEEWKRRREWHGPVL